MKIHGSYQLNEQFQEYTDPSCHTKQYGWLVYSNNYIKIMFFLFGHKLFQENNVKTI